MCAVNKDIPGQTTSDSTDDAQVKQGDFFSQGVVQLNLFDDNAPRADSAKLMEVLDHLNAKDGKGTLYFAGQGCRNSGL